MQNIFHQLNKSEKVGPYHTQTPTPIYPEDQSPYPEIRSRASKCDPVST